jgi:hypothetical protein
MNTNSAYHRIAFACATLLVVASAAAFDPTGFPAEPVVYRNGLGANLSGLFRDVTDTRSLTAGSTILAIGDEITLGGTQRQLTDLQYEYFLSSSSGNETAVISLFANTGPGGAPAATPFYMSEPQVLIAGQAKVTVRGISGFTLPDNFTYAVSFNGIDGAEQAGLEFYNGNDGGPSNGFDVGSSFDDHWVNSTLDGWVLRDFPGVIDNMGLAVHAVPEPGTWALLLMGAGTLVFLGYGRKR